MSGALLERLQRLARLYHAGKLSDEEFKQLKSRLIAEKLDDGAVAGLERLANLAGSGGLSESEFEHLKRSVLRGTEKETLESGNLEPVGVVAPSTQLGGYRGWTSIAGIVAAVSAAGLIYFVVTNANEPDCAGAETRKVVTEIALENGVLVTEIFSKMALKNASPEVRMLVPEAFVARSILENSSDYEKLKKETSAKDYSLDAIRLQSKDSVTKAVECKAILRLTTKAGKAEGEFTYTAEKTSDGRLYVVLDTSRR